MLTRTSSLTKGCNFPTEGTICSGVFVLSIDVLCARSADCTLSCQRIDKHQVRYEISPVAISNFAF